MATQTLTPAHAGSSGKAWVAALFLVSLIIPFYMFVGPVRLMPHRIVILIFFIPFFLQLFVFRSAGRVLWADWLMLGSALWAGVALSVNHGFGNIIEPFGIHLIEFFGAYLLARVAIRIGADFRSMVWALFLLILFLFPFAAAESLLKQPVLLQLLPGESIPAVNIGERMGMRRAQTAFAHPILYGVFVSSGFGLFWFALRPRWLRLPASAIVAVGTVFSLSTGALLSFVVQGIFIGWEIILKALRKRWTLFTILAILGYVIVDLISNRSPFHVLVTYGTFSTGSSYNRILIWQFGTQSVWANPVFGIGLGDWVRPGWMGNSVDNYWLLNAMQFGLPSVVMLLTAMVYLLRRVSLHRLSVMDERLCRAAYLTVFGGLFIAGGTVHYWHGMMAFVMFILGSGAWIISGGASTDDDLKVPDEPDETPRLSRYTRQPGPNKAIPRPGLVAASRAVSAKPGGGRSLHKDLPAQRP